MEIKVKIWIEDNKQNLIFGSGKTEILKEIEKTGSISDASKNLNMNYKKILGSLMEMISIVFVSGGTASMVGIGVEDMPKSLKEKR